MHRIALIAYNGLCHFEFATVQQAFSVRGFPSSVAGENDREQASWYDTIVVAAEPGPLQTREGLHFNPHYGLDALIGVDTIIIPGWRTDGPPPPRPFLSAIQEARSSGKRLVSICTGAFVLAEAGILDGQRATTHWKSAAELQQRYPAIRVDPNVLFIDEEEVLTSAGCAAGIDLCLHIIRKDFGARVANEVAKDMVISPLRQGGQAQFLSQPLPEKNRHDLAPLLERLSTELLDPPSIDEMAQRMAMSKRTFLRRFSEATGSTPGEWMTWRKLDKARHLLETSTDSCEHIATQCGFGSVETMRHHFRTRLHVSPIQYRQQFA